MPDARALWITGPGTVALRGEAVVRTPGRRPRRDAVERHQPRHRGASSSAAACPPAEHARMRAPLQAGDFPWPVKYGYAAVGRVIEGPPDLAGTHRLRPAPPSGPSSPLRPAMAVPVPQARAARPGGPRRQHGDRAQHRLGRRRPPPATASPSSAPAPSAPSSPGSAPACPARRSRWSTSTPTAPPSPRPSAAPSPSRRRRPPIATSSSTPAPRRRASPPRSPRRERRRPWSRRAGTATAAVPLALGGAFHAARLRLVVEPGRAGPARPVAPAGQPPPARGGARAPRRSGARRAPDRRDRLRRPARRLRRRSLTTPERSAIASVTAEGGVPCSPSRSAITS